MVPLVTNARAIACSLDTLFLRRDQPGDLIASSGDRDNRINVLFDALRLPQNADEMIGDAATEDPVYVLLEDDKLIVDLR
jgi:hypothetical protein